MNEHPIIFSGPMVRAIIDGTKTQTRRFVKPQCENGYFPCSYCPSGWGEATDPPGTMPRGCTCNCVPCPWQEGRRLWVREKFAYEHTRGHERKGSLCYGDGVWGSWSSDGVFYHHGFVAGVATHCLDGAWVGRTYFGKWKSSIHMPRYASRLTLEITDVRVQRLQEISGADAKSEGCEPDWEAFHDATEGMEGWEEPEEYIEECEEECDWINFGTTLVHSSEHREWLADRENYAMRLAFQTLWDKINGKRPGCSWADNPWVWAITFRRVDK